MTRIDNRKNDQIRDIKITRNYTKYAEGSVLIEMGSTKVICTASIEDKVPPFLRNTGTGWINAEYSMLPNQQHHYIMKKVTSMVMVGVAAPVYGIGSQV